MLMCDKCMKLCGLLMLVFGVLFLLQDLAVWNFWNISWWTVVFLLFGFGKLGMAGCKDCRELRKKK